MSKAAKSVFVFGWYLVLNGLMMTFAPNVMLGTLGIPPTVEPWLRCLGVVVLVLGLYYIQAGREEVTPFFRWTTWGRPIVLFAFVVMVIARVAPPVLIAFGLIDTAGAVWTALALRKQAARAM